jgi:beta-lactamase class A
MTPPASVWQKTFHLTAVLALAAFTFAGLGAPTQDSQQDSLQTDPALQRLVGRAVSQMGLTRLVHEGRLALSFIDLSDPAAPHYAGLNDREMMYAASLPKIAILVAGFERIREGLMPYTPGVKQMFTRLARYSSNEDASRAIHQIGFDYIAGVLTSPKYRLYDPGQNGGLWLGKAYGGPNDRWKRDPLHNLSHGATSLQVARFFLMMDEGRLVSPRFSAEIKEMLSEPGIHHKFVKGLDGKPDHRIYRKSGTWRQWHSDAALVEAGGKKYIAVALVEDGRGGEILPGLIRKLDDIVCNGETEPSQTLAQARRPRPH